MGSGSGLGSEGETPVDMGSGSGSGSASENESPVNMGSGSGSSSGSGSNGGSCGPKTLMDNCKIYCEGGLTVSSPPGLTDQFSSNLSPNFIWETTWKILAGGNSGDTFNLICPGSLPGESGLDATSLCQNGEWSLPPAIKAVCVSGTGSGSGSGSASGSGSDSGMGGMDHGGMADHGSSGSGSDSSMGGMDHGGMADHGSSGSGSASAMGGMDHGGMADHGSSGSA